MYGVHYVGQNLIHYKFLTKVGTQFPLSPNPN